MRVRRNRAAMNMKTALSFATDLQEYEERFSEMGWSDQSGRASELFFASILFLAASLEATLSETIQDFVEKDLITQAVANSLLQSNKPMLDRYSDLLKEMGLPPLEKGALPTQNVSAIMKMRNACMHFKPQFDDDAQESETLNALPLWHKGKSSGLFANANVPFFPHSCCSYFNAKLAVDAARDFLQIVVVQTLKHKPVWLMEGRGGYGHPNWWPEDDTYDTYRDLFARLWNLTLKYFSRRAVN